MASTYPKINRWMRWGTRVGVLVLASFGASCYGDVFGSSKMGAFPSYGMNGLGSVDRPVVGESRCVQYQGGQLVSVPCSPSGGTTQQQPAPSITACTGLSLEGQCSGNVLRWCFEGRLYEDNCGARGESCQFVPGTVGNKCVAGGGNVGGSSPSCGGIDARGACYGNVLRLCQQGSVREQDCGASGGQCQWATDRYTCTSASPGGSGGTPVTPGGTGSSISEVGANLSPQQAQEILSLHNQVRQQHQAQPLQWDPQLAQFAQQWADQCVFEHSSSPDMGENLAMGHRSFADAFWDWYNESASYDYYSGEGSGVVGHFTQIVWDTTTSLGCASANCGSTLYVCEYAPPGNWVGESASHVFPPQ